MRREWEYVGRKADNEAVYRNRRTGKYAVEKEHRYLVEAGDDVLKEVRHEAGPDDPRT